MTKVKFIDTTLRDGQQSLWALGMRTGMMLPALPHMDEAGFDEMEFFVPSVQLKKMIRDLKEDPWQWLKLGAAAVNKTKLRFQAYRHGIGLIPRSIDMLLLKIAVEHGLTTCRTSNPWNNYDEFKEKVEEMRSLGVGTIANLIYTISPRHTDEYYVTRAKAALKLKPYRLCLKDVGGLLKPERVRELFPKILSVIGDLPLEFHTHGTNGLALLNILEAVKLGVRYIHTAIPPLANGTSQASIFSVAKNLRALGYDPQINESALKPVEEHFTCIAKRENWPLGQVLEYDETLYSHKVPGGMESTFRFHLRQAGMEHRLAEVLVETAKVQEDFGYPIMVTPFSQFVGTQAVFNVVTGEPYKEVTDEVILYALGHYGQEAMEVMDQNVLAKILDRPRAAELAKKPGLEELSIKDLRRKFGENLSDEELILRVYIDEEAVKIARNAPPVKPYLTSRQPLVQLMQELTKIKKRAFISIEKPEFSIKLGARPASDN